MNAMTYPGQNEPRLLLWCIAGSLLLHAFILWRAQAPESAPPPAPQITATLRTAPPPPAAAPAPTPAVEPAKPEPKPEPPKPEAKAKPEPPPPVPTPKPERTVPPREPKAAAEPKASATPSPQPAPTPTPAPSSDTKSDAKTDTAKAAPTPAPAAPASPSAGAADADDLAFVRSYQQQLAQVTNKYKVYPRVALDQQWQGTALVRLRIGADGKIQGVETGNSSGHEILDEKAREAVSKAKPLVQIPERLRGKEFIAEVRVVYQIEAGK